MENVLRNWGSFVRKKEIWKPLSPQTRGCGNDIFQSLQINQRRSRYVLYFGWRDICLAAIGNIVRNKIPEGSSTRKRMAKPSSEKFTPRNLVYCQQFIDTVSSLPPEKIKFFDEAGIHCGMGNPVYGNSLKGTTAIEITRGNKKGANITLNLLCGLEGVLYANTLEGASNSIQFLNFFGEAGQVSNSNGNAAIEFGDYTVMDNCATHRFESGHILQRWLMQTGASIIYTPSSMQLNLFLVNLKMS